MQFFRHLLKYPLANPLGHSLLQKHVRTCLWLMGIGAGANLNNSGETAVIRKLLRNGADRLTVIDVGANCGQFLNLVTGGLGKRLKEIHSFEPATATFKALQLAAPNCSNIFLNNLALGAELGKQELFYDKECSVLASLTKRDLSLRHRNFDKHETVEVTTLTNYCIENNISHIDWLKIDVEGHELDVLYGSSPLFEKNAIEMVTFEFGGCNIDTRTFLRDFYNFFNDLGMRLHRITPSGYFHPIKRYHEIEEQFTAMNYIAFRSNQ